MAGKLVYLSVVYSVLASSGPEAKDDCADSLVPNAPYDVPDDGKLVCRHSNYLTAYNLDLKAPIWSSYHITYEDVENEKGGRRSFKPDPDIPEEHQEPLHSKCWGTKWNRGHLCPSYIMSFDKKKNGPWDDTYYITNTAMQWGPFNQQTWMHLEKHVVDWIRHHQKSLHIVTGTIWKKGAITKCDLDTGKIWKPKDEPNATNVTSTHMLEGDKDRKHVYDQSLSEVGDSDDDGDDAPDGWEPKSWMGVPDEYFKILCDVDAKKSIAYHGHNFKDDAVLPMTVQELEKKTGLNFWTPDSCGTAEKDDDYWYSPEASIAMGYNRTTLVVQQMQAEKKDDAVIYI